jgi:hypothetical protein
MLLGPLTALLLEEKEDKKSQNEEDIPQKPNPLGKSYFLLFLAT